MPLTTTLTEVMFVVHFQAPLNMTFADVLAWSQQHADLPIQQQLPILPPIQQTTFDSVTQLQNLTLSFGVESAVLPRLQLRSGNKPIIMQLQMDRFIFSWTRIGEIGFGEHYPGYQDMRALWMDSLLVLNQWHEERFKSSAAFRLLELSYFNAVPLHNEDGSTRKLSDLYSFITPGRPVNGFQATWTELLELSANAPRVVAATGVGAMTGASANSSRPVMFFNFSGMGSLDDVGARNPTIAGLTDSLHERIFDMYQASITSQG